MRYSSRLVCALCVFASMASVGEANAQAKWSCVAVLKEADIYPVRFGPASDGGSTYVESNSDGYTGAASLYRAANSAATGQSVWADEASYTVTWTLSGPGAMPSLSVFSKSTAWASVTSGVSSGQDMANVGIAGVAAVFATMQGLQAGGKPDSHDCPAVKEVVTMNGQVTCKSTIHPAAGVSKNGQGFQCSATFQWTAAIAVPAPPQ